jgi:type I restriction enzyme, R subunit
MSSRTYKTSTEAGTVQEPILNYVSNPPLIKGINDAWIFVPQQKAEEYRHFDKSAGSQKEQAKTASLFFNNILFAKAIEFNRDYSETAEELCRRLIQIPATIQGNNEMLQYLRNQKNWFNSALNKEDSLVLIDYEYPENNVYHVTEEYWYNNGRFANRADIVFLINGIPVLIIECKNATKDEAIAIGINQLRRYHEETPEMMVPEQLFTSVDSLGFHYGVTWNLKSRNIFEWKSKETGNLEAKVKEFCHPLAVLAFLKDYILFQLKDDELNKYILMQHQTEAVELIISRLVEDSRKRGLVWHTQGSGKTFTIIKVAEKVYKDHRAGKPTVLVLIDRNELEDQMARNIESLKVENITIVTSRIHLDQLLTDDYRGIIICMFHKFDKTDKALNTRENIYVLIDEAHRTTNGDMGTYLMASLPNATLIGFTGTPIDNTAKGKGTFKIFNDQDNPDPKGYLHKYSMKDSIEDKTTLPLNYALAPNELRIPAELLEKEFLSLAETEGICDIHELNKILEKIGFRSFLKGSKRIDAIAKYVAEHYQKNVEPLGYKALLVTVDRQACALYKNALDKYLPAEYSKPVYSEYHNDSKELKEFYLTEKEEKILRKDFSKRDTFPKILIVTEKLLTGFDAPNLYAMYLDKPMRDHTLLQAVARVNRPYYDEVLDLEKKYGFVLDFIGIFDKLEKALSFDSDEINAIIRDIQILKDDFKKLMETEGEIFIALVGPIFNDKTVNTLVQEFKDKGKRHELYRFYKRIELLYEIISPDAFLVPYIQEYIVISNIVAIVKKAFDLKKGKGADREFLAKTEELIKKHSAIDAIGAIEKEVIIDADTLEQIKKDNKKGDDTRVINLVKSIEKYSTQDPEDPNLISLKKKAEDALNNYEDKQETTQEMLRELENMIEQRLAEEKEQAEKQFDDITYFVFKHLREQRFKDPDNIAGAIRSAFVTHPYWSTRDAEQRELRKEIYTAILKIDHEAEIERTKSFVDTIFTHLNETIVR